MNEVSYIVDTTLQPQECFRIRILISNLRSPLMKIISTPLYLTVDSFIRKYNMVMNENRFCSENMLVAEVTNISYLKNRYSR